mmetsp:Transcript_21686/g.25047  ORF Transcript_21686/g.25047 Transcript_21686/m.25047 type:complete len:112 (+) Transcript_21686:194-529(+)
MVEKLDEMINSVKTKKRYNKNEKHVVDLMELKCLPTINSKESSDSDNASHEIDVMKQKKKIDEDLNVSENKRRLSNFRSPSLLRSLRLRKKRRKGGKEYRSSGIRRFTRHE